MDRVEVVDRAAWVRANTSAFAGLIGKLEGPLLDQMLPEGSGFTKASMTLANRWITTRQLGLLLGFMGARVLGQYDLALISAEATPGRLLFVEENIRNTARVMDVPLGPFRTWIALHETTHAFEFEAHPWLRPYLAGRLERQLSLFSDDAASLGRDAVRSLGAALRGDGRRDDQHWLERLMSDEQRRLFRETQAIMALLEGFGDHVMDAVGQDLVPGVERISKRFHGRREQRTRRSSAPCCGSPAWTSRWTSTVRARCSWPRSSGSRAPRRCGASGTARRRCPRPRRSRARTRGSGGWASPGSKEASA